MEIILLSAPIIDQLLIDERFNQLPCLKNPAKLPLPRVKSARSGKSCCGQPKPAPVVAPPQEAQIDYNQVKLCIHNLSPAEKTQLRESLGCDLVVMQFKNSAGALLRDEF